MDSVIAAVRRFNRFFTQHIGAIDARFLGTETNLPEARLLFEIATRAPVAAHVLGELLDLDRGYLSRMLARFERRGWIAREPATRDSRTRPVRLTPAGQDVFDALDARQRAAVAADLDRLDALEREDLAEALTTVRLLLDPSYGAAFAVRPFGTGDVNRIVARQARLYALGYGWGRPLELLEAETVAAFLRDFTPEREQCWVAEIEGVMAGAVFLTDGGDGSARLRLLHVERFARRRGIGDALVAGCVSFAREAGYEAITLWTHSILTDARRLYARHGFVCIATEMHARFGTPVQGETWRLSLARD